MKKLTVGSRGSELALIQTKSALSSLAKRYPSLDIDLVVIRTTGDHITDRPLHDVGGAGLFIKEIEGALLEQRIDFALHSMKDIPSNIADGLVIAATLKRLEPRDALVSKGECTFDELPEGARVATGSLRRRSQLLAHRPDFMVSNLRGNVTTRLKKFDQSDWNGIILAAAGLMRLGCENRIQSLIPTDMMLPAVGQGALAFQARTADEEVCHLLSTLNHPETAVAISAERSFLRRLQGGCQVPIAAHGIVSADQLRLTGYVGSIDGKRWVRQELEGSLEEAETIGVVLAERMLADGADKILFERSSGAS